MKLIKTITDKDFLTSETLSASKPRITVRTIMLNNSGMVAVMYSSKFKLYSFPGGGVEAGECMEEALKREVFEETGCRCEILTELGSIYENRGQMDYTQLSYYYITKQYGKAEKARLTQDEEKNGTGYGWHSIEETDQLLQLSAHETLQQKYLQARDMAAYAEFRKAIQNQG